jgi:DNA-binding MarR family transcriptional regulator
MQDDPCSPAGSAPPALAVPPSAVRAWVRLTRAQHAVQAAVERALKAEGLPPLGWYDVLLELTRPQDGRLRPFEIEERTLLAQYNLSRLLDRLEREDLVRREAFGDDGRGRWVVITDKGRETQALMWQVYAKALRESVASKLDDAEADRLTELLARLESSSKSRFSKS